MTTKITTIKELKDLLETFDETRQIAIASDEELNLIYSEFFFSSDPYNIDDPNSMIILSPISNSEIGSGMMDIEIEDTNEYIGDDDENPGDRS